MIPLGMHGLGNAVGATPPLPDLRLAARRPTVRAPLRRTLSHRRPGYDLHRAPYGVPDLTSNALCGGLCSEVP